MADDQFKAVEASIQRKIEFLVPISPSNHSIYEVPHCIRQVNRVCYEPLVVSIGPIYYKRSYLKYSQEIKLSYLQFFLELTGKFGYGLEQCFNTVKGWEEKARSYYEKKIHYLSSTEFIEMLMVDAAFIIALFIDVSEVIPCESKNLRNKLASFTYVNQDLFVEENQIPYFVLNDLYDEIFGAHYPLVSFSYLTLAYLHHEVNIPGKEAAISTLSRKKVGELSNIDHLVHFLRICYLPSILRSSNPPSTNNKYFKYPMTTAKELKAAGVTFLASESESLLDISFSKGVLKIPKLLIEDTTEAIFRNIIFYEQSHYYHDSYFVDYMIFLDDLIDTPEDVQILVQNGIIQHWLGSDADIVTVINSMLNHITVCSRNFYYNDVCRKLNAYASKRWNKWKAILRRNYFNHPWSITSVIYLVILLILTVLQVYTGFK